MTNTNHTTMTRTEILAAAGHPEAIKILAARRTGTPIPCNPEMVRWTALSNLAAQWSGLRMALAMGRI